MYCPPVRMPVNEDCIVLHCIVIITILITIVLYCIEFLEAFTK